MLVQETSSGDYVLTKSPAFFNKTTEDKTANAFAVASYAYGPPKENGESADTPPGGYTGFVRLADKPRAPGLPPHDILPPRSAHKLEHMETVVSAHGMVAVVYKNVKTGEVIVGFKGSASPAELVSSDPGVMAQAVADWETNRDSRDSLPPQYAESAELLAAVLKRFPDRPVTVAGHSKGGGQVQYALMANRREIEAREASNKKNMVSGVGVNPAMPAGALRALQDAGLVQKDHPEKDSFAKRHIQLYAVRSEAGQKEILSNLNENVVKDVFQGAYLGETNILFTESMPGERLINASQRLTANLPLPWNAKLALLAMFGSAGAATLTRSIKNHGMSVGQDAFDNERALPNSYHLKADENGNFDKGWADDHAGPPIAVSQWRKDRCSSSCPNQSPSHGTAIKPA